MAVHPAKGSPVLDVKVVEIKRRRAELHSLFRFGSTTDSKDRGQCSYLERLAPQVGRLLRTLIDSSTGGYVRRSPEATPTNVTLTADMHRC